MNMYTVVPNAEIQLGHCRTRDRREGFVEIPAVTWPGTSSYWGMMLHRRLPDNLCIHSTLPVPIFLTTLRIFPHSPSSLHHYFLYKFIHSLFLSLCSSTSIALKYYEITKVTRVIRLRNRRPKNCQIPGRRQYLLSAPEYPKRICGSRSPISKGKRRLFVRL